MGKDEDDEDITGILDELHENTEEHSVRIEKLEKSFEKRDQNVQLENILSDLSYPFGLQQFLLKEYYRERIQGNLEEFINGPILGRVEKKMNVTIRKLQKEDLDNQGHLQTQSAIIKSGKEFLDFSEHASLLTKPMLIYYGSMQILSGLIGSCLIIKKNLSEKERREGKSEEMEHHGLLWGKGEGWKVGLCPGFFQKLVVSLEVCGEFTIFSHPMLRKYNMKKLNKEVDSQDIIDVNRFLIRYLNLFLFNSKSRYDPATWLDFLKGTEPMYQVMVNTYRTVYPDLLWFIKIFKGINRI